MKAATPKAQLDAFIDKYSPDVAALGRRAFAQMRKLIIKSVSAKQRPRRAAPPRAKKA